MVEFDIPAILCEYTGIGPDTSSTYRYLLHIAYKNKTSDVPQASDVAEAVLEELRNNPPAYSLTETDFDTLKVEIRVVRAEWFPSKASSGEQETFWAKTDYATMMHNSYILSERTTPSEGDTSLLAIVLMPARVAQRPTPTAVHAAEESVEAPYQAYRETIAEAGRKRQPPSRGAHASELSKTQKKSRVDAVYNHRPLDLAAPPITIYHPVFAKFLAMVAEPLDGIEFTRKELDLSWKFIANSTSYHNTEYSRVAAIRNVFGSAVHRHIATPTSLTYSSGTVEPDGVVTALEAAVGAFTPISCITEVKNEMGTGECDPLAQAECGRRHSARLAAALRS
ncbi:hypothetical protein DAEQUDRAFT_368518 [Daedalea quercina L-15889]|uniref:Uncharacterized protein n=1 Tax=Daedalea quercina L-15889 TaxID=1314783 RepID=A0A165PAA6_9APHY|nr:hypothetical protein DAEQUDRAFT_368518 [Daedalea quercina L-15889]